MSGRWGSAWLGLALWCGAAWGADVLGDGVEADLAPRPALTPAPQGTPPPPAEPAPVVQPVPAIPDNEARPRAEVVPDAPPPVVAQPAKPPLKPIAEYQPKASAPLVLPGPEREYDGGYMPPAPARAQEVKLGDVTADRGAAPLAPAPVDLIADRPGTPAAKATGPFAANLDAYEPEGLLSPSAKRAYEAVAALRKQIEQIGADLDAGGKERTRLIYSSEAAGKCVSDLAKIWPDDQDFRDICLSAKRTTLVLEEELRQEPRSWSHVRWAFSATLVEVKRLRKKAVDLADAEPKPIVLKGKDGKELIVEAPRDPEKVHREEEMERRDQSQAQKEKLKRQQLDAKKKDPPLSASE